MAQQQETEKDEIINGPFTISLSATGVENFMQRGQKIKKFRFFDGSEDFGLEVPSITFKSLQKMAMTGMITRIESSISTFATQRRHIMELTRCFAIATVYRQFETRLWEIIGRSDLLTQWNRANPRLNINPNVNSAAPSFVKLIDATKTSILAYKQEVLKSVLALINRDQKSLAEEKKSLTMLAIRYINAIDPVIWLLMAASKDATSSTILVNELQKLLSQYVGRSELPEYLALMLVELVVIVGDVRGDSDIAATDSKSTGVFISYELGTMKKSQEERTKVRIQVGNEASDFSILRSKIDQQSNVNAKQKSLDTFFASGKADLATPGAIAMAGNQDLGLYYLSYLKEACKKMDISLDSFVNIIPHTKRTNINLILAI